MVFSSFLFLCYFLPLTFVGYYLAPRWIRNYVLLSASILFYAWGAPGVVPLLLVSCAIDYHISQRLKGKGMGLLTLGVGLNLLSLGYYKYANFFVEQTNLVRSWFGASPMGWEAVALPVGVSFFTFHKISYLVDCYRRQEEPARSYAEYLLYVLLFPQLVAGPIVRYLDVAGQIRNRVERRSEIIEGIFRFCIGLGRKILIADSLAVVADGVFGLSPLERTTGWAWIGILAYSFQIYFDFSGYSDMAIGLGKMFGLTFRENFLAPYRSRTFSEFWRRWHISLSSWMREYLYIPLGGSRGSPLRTYINLWLVFLFSGLWHGAAWNFVAWGAYHGGFLVLEKAGWGRVLERLPSFVSMTITFVLVTLGWVLFRAPDLASALVYIQTLAGVAGGERLLRVPPGLLFENRAIVVFLIASLIVLFERRVPDEERKDWVPYVALPRLALYGGASVVALLLAMSHLAAKGYAPFLYFRF